MSDITTKEAEALLKFREKLADLNLNEDRNSDSYLIRWLRARDLSLKKSEEMLRAHLRWREENDVDTITEWKAPEKYETMFPMEILGYDRFGHPICILPHRFLDLNEVWKCERQEYVRYGIQTAEKLMNMMKKCSTPENPIYQCTVINDMDQVNILKFMDTRCFDVAQEVANILNENYPEVIHKIYFLDSPRLFTVLYAMVKHFFPEKTLEKFRIFGHKKESWISELLEDIPLEQLPIRYGGTDAEFEKTAFLNCKLPAGMSSNRDDLIEDGMIKENVPAGKKLTLEYKIMEPKSKLKWSFKSVNHDILFSVNFDGKELFNHGRVESHRKTQEGFITCEKEGEYALVFENTYSTFRSKTIYYRVEVENP